MVFLLMGIVFFLMTSCPKDPSRLENMRGIKQAMCANQSNITSFAAGAIALLAAFGVWKRQFDRKMNRARNERGDEKAKEE